MNRAGFIEEPNYKETRDSKGNIIRCYRCNLTPDGRDIIPCDFCPAKWHLDCVDPPLAVPPRRRAGDKPSAAWRCPLHIDHDLLAVSRQAEKAPGDLGRVPKLRKPKNAIPLDVSMSRGFRNNGVIEIDIMKDQPEIDKTKEVQMNGRVYRIPEMSVRMDFIDRVKKSWYEDQSLPRLMNAPKKIRGRKYRPDGAVLHHPPEQSLVKIRRPDFYTGANALAITETAKANAALRKRSIREQQTVINLAQMSQKGIDGYSGDSLAELTNQLISAAPDKVVNAVERTEVDQLLQLQELISERLALLNGPSNTLPTMSFSRQSSHGKLNGNRIPAAQDPNIDPVLRGGGSNVLLPTKTLPDQKLPVDRALETSPVNIAPNPKPNIGDNFDHGGIPVTHESVEEDWNSEEGSPYPTSDEAELAETEAEQVARLGKEAADRRWLEAFFPARNPSPARNCGSPANHPLGAQGNRNGYGMDRMDMGP